MQIKKLAFLIISIIAIFTGCEEKVTQDSIVTNNQQQVASVPTFNLLTTDSKQLKVTVEKDKWNFEGHEGKVVLLNFWATWCPPCKAEIPHLIKLQNKYKDKFEVIAVLVEENKSTDDLKAFMKEYNVNYTVTNSNENFKLADAVGGVKSIPTMFMFDTKGNAMEKYVGMVPTEMLESDIKKGLGK